MTGKPTTPFRGGRAVDGGLLNFLPLPPAPAPEGGAARGGEGEGEEEEDLFHSVGVCCFPSAATIGARLGPGRLIAPDVFEPVSAPEPPSSSSSSGGSGEGGADPAAAAAGAARPSPLLSAPPTFATLLGWAFSPTSEENLLALAALGEADARAWAGVELGGDDGGRKGRPAEAGRGERERARRAELEIEKWK